MKRLNSTEELQKLSRELAKARDPKRLVVSLCNTGCAASGSQDVCNAFISEIEKRGLGEKVEVKLTGCHGFCEQGPVCVIYPKKIFYKQLQPEDVPEIVDETLVGGRVVKRLLWTNPESRKKIVKNDDVVFYAKQRRVVLEKNGLIDPTSLSDYLATGGYGALAKVLGSMTPDQVVEEIEKSGLRGRGGAGFPTGQKWRFTKNAAGAKKYLVCNADEGDPGAFMDRSVLEGNIHLVVEGMLIAAYAIGADEGYVYVRAEYPLSVKYLEKAIEDCEEVGLLGDNILGTSFNFHLKYKEGAGAFVCGEETALLASIEGKRGTPRPRPPFPAIAGLWGKPTNINNVETYANVPIIIEKGAEEYAKVGTERSKGTKIFSLTGKVKNTGLVEVPIGSTLREVIYDIGGGILKNRKFKAAQMGGPSGGCIPAQHLDMPIDYETLNQIGSMMGSGGMIVMDEATCMVDTARFFLTFTQSESCGKCVPCRIGTRRMLQILTRICSGEGTMEDLTTLEQLGQWIKSCSLCGLGQTAPNPVLSTLRYFRDEYIAHIRDKRCPAAVCDKLMKAPCEHTCPINVDAVGYISLIAAGRHEDAFHLVRQRNPLESVCGRVCHHPCETRCKRGDIDEPVNIMHLKRFAADYALKKRVAPRIFLDRPSGRKVAVIGSGPAGLNAAYHLAKRGHRVTIFEAFAQAGGMLRYGIPEFRLPRPALDSDIDFIRAHGVEMRFNTPIGVNDLSVSSLLSSGYSAVFCAVGAHQGMKLGIKGEDKPGVFDGVSYLREINSDRKPQTGKRVLVIGGGNVAIDAARSALRLGAEEVTIVYRRTLEEMPANSEEIEEARHEGINILFLTAPNFVIGDARADGLMVTKMKLGDFDTSGRRRPVPIEGSEYELPADTIIAAIGQAVDHRWIGQSSESVVSKRGLVIADPLTLATSIPGLFAGGDAVTGPWTVTGAMEQGERAAISIDLLLNGKDPSVGRTRKEEPSFDVPPPATLEPVDRSRCKIREVAASKRISSFIEVSNCLSEKAAIAEAERCLRCDLE
ncbi:MAG: FAD-dependent oxidoreductase [Deltaproteobacteria bacterium]|nr:FAD-dependent oxidoreductase [Deltaproteobacteria bacterium]